MIPTCFQRNYKIVDFTKCFLRHRIVWKCLKFSHRQRSGNCRILLPRFCCKNFVKSIFLLKSFTLSWFDGKNLRGSEFIVYPQHSVLPPFQKIFMKSIYIKKVTLTKFLKKMVGENQIFTLWIVRESRFLIFRFPLSAVQIRNTQMLYLHKIYFFFQW